ncbi:hypothetical protein VYU27_002016 [Nannochloropsis oceanica]
MPEELELTSGRWDGENMGRTSSIEEDSDDSLSDGAEEEIQTLLWNDQSMPVLPVSSRSPLVTPPITSSTSTSSSTERHTPSWDKNEKANTSLIGLNMPVFANLLSPRTRSGPAALFQRGSSPSPRGASSSFQHHHSSYHAHSTARGGGGGGGRDGGRDRVRESGRGKREGREGGHSSAPPDAGIAIPRLPTPRSSNGRSNKGISLGTPNIGPSECMTVTSTITSTGSDPFNDMIAFHRGSSSSTAAPRRRAHGRGFALVFLVFTAAVLFLLFLVTILHLSLMRHEASTRLGHVLGIIESAGLLPEAEIGKEGGRALSAAAGEVVMAVMDGKGGVAVGGKEGGTEERREGGTEEGTKRVLVERSNQEEDKLGHRELGMKEEEEGEVMETTGLMGDIWKRYRRPPPYHRPPPPPHGPPAKLCSVTYKMNVSEHEAKAIDLDPYDQELLGTIMVRICNCGCARQDNLNSSSSSPSPPSPPRVDSLTLMSEILRGAHIVVEEDRGAFYSWFTHMQDSYRRTSSHRSIVPMYGIDEGSVLRTILTGRTGDGHTWFQFEGAGWEPFKKPFESFLHAVNYVQYRVTGKQVGPLGVSAFTDRRPIRLRFDGCLDAGVEGEREEDAGREGGQEGRGRRRLLFEQMERDDPRGKERPPSLERDIDRAVGKAMGLLFKNASCTLPPSSSSSSPSHLAGISKRGGDEKRKMLRRKAQA